MKDLVDNYLEFLKEVGKIIGYGSLESYPRAFDDCRDSNWEISGEELTLYGNDKEDQWNYTLSSFSSMGEKFYMGEKDGLTFVMAYIEENGWDSAKIFILDNKNKQTDERFN